MGLSVIVTSYRSPGTLRRCLESLASQPEAEEILVADCSPGDPAPDLAPLFPRARFLHFEALRSVPQLRWAAFRETRGETIAATEARCVPSPTWCAELVQAHREFPAAPAIGGPVGIARPASAFDLGLYFCEYGAYAPPVRQGEVAAISGANLSYKRSDLEKARDVLDAGDWETRLHARWAAEGRRLRLCGAAVVFENSMEPATAIRQRFHYGRGYAADRVRGSGALARLLHAAVTPALPALMLWRQALAAKRSSLVGDLPRASPWVLLLNAAWSAGEFTGYLLGRGTGPRNF